MPAIETVAMPKVAGKARSYVPTCTSRQTKLRWVEPHETQQVCAKPNRFVPTC